MNDDERAAEVRRCVAKYVPGKTEEEYLLRVSWATSMAVEITDQKDPNYASEWLSQYRRAIRLLGLVMTTKGESSAHNEVFGYEVNVPEDAPVAPPEAGIANIINLDAKLYWWKEDPALHRIVCAAQRGENGFVITGVRHYDPIMNQQIKMMKPELQEGFRHQYGEDSGFLDNYGIYRNRYEAFQIAVAAGQLHQVASRVGHDMMFNKKLYSEMVW